MNRSSDAAATEGTLNILLFLGFELHLTDWYTLYDSGIFFIFLKATWCILWWTSSRMAPVSLSVKFGCLIFIKIYLVFKVKLIDWIALYSFFFEQTGELHVIIFRKKGV